MPAKPASRRTHSPLLSLGRSLIGQLLEADGLASWEWEPRTDRLRLTPARAYLGRAAGEELDTAFQHLLRFVHSRDRSRVRDWLAALARGEPRGELRCRALHRSGRMHHYLLTADLCTGRRRLRRLLGTLQDVTDRVATKRRMLRRQAVLLQLARDVQSPLTGADQALQQLAGTARKAIAADRVTVWLLQPDADNRLYCAARSGRHAADDEPGHIDWPPNYAAALSANRLLVANDCTADPRVADLRRGYLEPLGIRALLDVAILRDGTLAGVICFEQLAPRQWALDEQQFAVSVADLLAVVLERVGRQAAEQALARSEALLEDLINNAPSAVYVKDLEGRYLLVNRWFEQITQLDRDWLLGRSDDQLPSPELAAVLRSHDADILASRSPLEVVERLPLPGGERTMLSVKFPLFDGSGDLYGTATISGDITDYERTLVQLRESEARFRALAEASFEAMMIHGDGRIIEVNSNLLRMFGYSREQLLGANPFSLVIPEDRERVERLSLQGNTLHYEANGLRADGSNFPIEVKSRATDLNGMSVRVVTARDLTDQRNAERALRASEERYRAFIAASAEAIWRADVEPPMPITLGLEEQQEWLYRNTRISECNQSMARMYGFEFSDDAIGLAMDDLYGERYFRRIASRFIRLGYHVTETETPYRNRRGEFVWLSSSFFGTVENGHLCRIWGVQRDVTERRRHIAELEHQATHDPLTGLYNRKWLTAAVDSRISDDPDVGFALLFIDLDHFKEINDALGHHIGDLLLAQIGPRLRPLLGEARLARLGGDEFAVLLPDADAREAETLARSLVEAIRQPFEIAGLRLEAGASIGAALFPEHGQDSNTLMRCADIAMYLAKRDRLGWALYRPELDEHSPRRLALITDLGPAMRDNQLYLMFQPKIDLHSGHLTGFEALLRWRHPVHGSVPPEQFIPLAEMGEVIRPLTLWVIEQALMQLQEWYRQGMATCVAVNISPRNLLDEDYPEQLERLLRHYRVPADALQLEITEGALIADPERALAVIQRIHALGVRLAIDDFGTGYSSLSYLQRLPLDTLKIDMSFVRQMLLSHADAMIVHSTIGLAHNLGLRVVAEGVEDAATLEMLREIGCDEAQGYHIARPLPAAQATMRLREAHTPLGA